MAVKFVSPEEMVTEITNAVKDYTEDVAKGIEKEVSNTAKLVLAETKALAPVDSGDYQKGFAIKKEKKQGEIVATIYNKTQPGLVHILELGHVIKNQYDTYDHTDARPHLVPAYDRFIGTMVNNIEGIIKKGG